MINAKQAREQTIDITAVVQRNQLTVLETQTKNRIAAAIQKGQCLIEVTVPAELDPALVNAFKRVMVKLGYRATLSYELGYMDNGGAYYPPKTTLTVGW